MQTRTITRTPPDREPRPASWFATASFAIAFFVLTLRWGSAPAGNEVDPSWTAVMAWAFRHGARWGADVVFTHGPLGFLHPLASYDPSTHGVFLTAQLAIAALGSVVAALVFRTLDRIGQAWLFASIVVFHASLWADTLWIALLAMSMVALARSIATKATDGTVLALAASTIVYGAIVAMIKVSLLPLVVLWAVAAPLMCAIDRRPRTALVVTVLFPSVFVALWIAAAQPLAMLPAHLGWSLHIAAAYGHAMGAGASIPVDLLGLAVFGSTAIVLVRLLADARRDGVRAIALLYTGAALFLAWRAGFTRADAHTMTFFGALAVTLAVVPMLAGAGRRSPIRVACGSLSAIAIPLFIAGSAGTVTPMTVVRAAPDHVRALANLFVAFDAHVATLDALRARAARQVALPTIRALVGDAPVDFFGNQQGIVFANGLSYRPRPVFQSYVAYTPALSRLNEDWVRGPASADWVLVGHAPIDDHVPTSEDALTLLALMRGYVAVARESDYLLLRRHSATIDPTREPAAPDFAIGEIERWIAMPPALASGAVLHIRAEPSAAGRVLSILVREPSWFIELELDDGAIVRDRVVRGAVAGGFLVSPYVASIDDYARLFAAGPLRQVRRFRLCAASARLAPFFARRFSYAISEGPRPGPLPVPQEPAPPAR